MKYQKDSLLHNILLDVGQITKTLSVELELFELHLDENLRRKIISYINNELTEIDKIKKKLSKARLNYDACRSRMRSNAGQNATVEKQNVIESEAEEARRNFHSVQDMLAIELFNFISKEKEYASLFISVK
uniref:Rho GTPase-activating protein 17 (Trinotate prediction) n=1 Tax=Henneguya salminicola TaxID=69463 RepID=A0A6G3MDP1_HENSL